RLLLPRLLCQACATGLPPSNAVAIRFRFVFAAPYRNRRPCRGKPNVLPQRDQGLRNRFLQPASIAQASSCSLPREILSSSAVPTARRRFTLDAKGAFKVTKRNRGTAM